MKSFGILRQEWPHVRALNRIVVKAEQLLRGVIGQQDLSFPVDGQYRQRTGFDQDL